jgi:hypothetical protein
MRIIITVLVALALASDARAQDIALDRVQNLINAGRFTEAGNTLTQWERGHGADSNASSNDRARALLLRGLLTTDAPQAQETYLAVVMSYPASPSAPQALLRLGQGFVASGDARRAIAYLERLRSDYPRARERDTGLLWLARAYAAATSMTAACNTARDAARSTDPNVRTLAELERDRVCAGQPAQRRDTARAQPRPVPATPVRADTARVDAQRTSAGDYAVQFAAFSVRSSATSIAAQLRAQGFDARVAQTEGSELFRVRVGNFASNADADRMAQRMRAAGFAGIIVNDVKKERR